MGRKENIPYEVKLDAINAYLNGKKGPAQICNELQIHDETFYRWLAKYQSQGSESLKNCQKNTFYPSEMKFAAIHDYLSGNGLLMDLMKKYKLSSKSVLERWIKKYNGHEALKSKNSVGGKIMTDGRKTTYEERVEIVSFCIANNDNYQLTSEKFQVSYQQVYTWVKEIQRKWSG